MNIWRILGIPPASDADMIRKAYAVLAKQYHPEDHPKEFKRLNEAYRQALAAARCNPVKADTASIPPEVDQNESFDEEFDFFDLSVKNTDFSHWNQNALDTILQMRSMIVSKERRLSIWKAFLRNENFTRAMDEPLFIGQFTDYLRQHLYSYRLALFREIERRYFSDSTRDHSMPPYRQLSQLLEKRKSHAKRQLKSFVINHRVQLFVIGFWVIIITLLFMTS